MHVSTAVPLLIAGGSLQLTTYQDLADGALYGSYALSVADNGTNVEIALNAAAIAEIDAGLSLFAIGGHVTTLTSGFEVESAFRGTGESSLRELVIETVPAPGTGSLVGLGLLALARRRISSTKRDQDATRRPR